MATIDFIPENTITIDFQPEANPTITPSPVEFQPEKPSFSIDKDLLKTDELDYEQALKDKNAQIDMQSRLAFLQERAKKAAANDPRNWTYDQTRQYFKDNPPKTPAAEAQVKYFLDNKKQTLDGMKKQLAMQDQIKQLEAAEALDRQVNPGLYQDIGLTRTPTRKEHALIQAAQEKDMWEKLPPSTKFDVISEKLAGKALPYLVTLPAAGVIWPFMLGFEGLQQAKNIGITAVRGGRYKPLENRSLTEFAEPLFEQIPDKGTELPDLPTWAKVVSPDKGLIYKAVQWAAKNPRKTAVVGASLGEIALDFLIVKNGFRGADALKEAFSPEAKGAFAALGLSPNATTKEIEQQYRSLAMQLHPDRGGSVQDFQNLENSIDVIRKSRQTAVQKILNTFRESKSVQPGEGGTPNVPVATGESSQKIGPIAGGIAREDKLVLKQGEELAGREAPIKITKDTSITDIAGKKVTLPQGEEYTPYLVKDVQGNISKIVLQDGNRFIIDKTELQNIKEKVPAMNSIKTEEIDSFISSPAIPEVKAEYKINKVDKPLIISKVQEFINRFIKFKDTPIEGKFGHKIYFSPSDLAVNRIGEKQSLIEYALHSLTRKAGDNYNIRMLDKSKVDNIGNIEKIITEADGYYEEGNKVNYVKKVNDSNRPYALIVLEKTPQGLKFTEDSLRYVTHLPGRKLSQISIKNTTQVTPPSLSSGQGSYGVGGEPSALTNKEIPQTEEIVKEELSPQGKERKFITTVKEADKTSPEVASQVTSNYTPITNKETLAAAQKLVTENYNGAINLVEGPEKPTALSNAVSIVLIDKAQQEGRFADAVRLVETTAEKQTELGQAIQALSIYERLTPEGILQYAEKQIRRARRI